MTTYWLQGEQNSTNNQEHIHNSHQPQETLNDHEPAQESPEPVPGPSNDTSNSPNVM